MKIKNYEVKLKALKNEGIKFDKKGKDDIYLNEAGEVLKKICINKSSYKWVNEVSGKVEEKAYKSFEGKPFPGIDGTEEVTESEIETLNVGDALMDSVENTLTYLASCEELKAELKASGKALRFAYAIKGAKIHDKTVIYYHPIKDVLIMKACAGSLSQMELTEKVSKVKITKGLAKVKIGTLLKR